MNSIKFSYAAYAATWTIHLLYIGSLVRRYRRFETGTQRAEAEVRTKRSWQTYAPRTPFQRGGIYNAFQSVCRALRKSVPPPERRNS